MHTNVSFKGTSNLSTDVQLSWRYSLFFGVEGDVRKSAVMAAAEHIDVLLTRLIHIKQLRKLSTMIHDELVSNKILKNKTVWNLEEN